jgi:hypothetical protein
MQDQHYRRLEHMEIIQPGDEYDNCRDAWRDPPVWVPVNPRSYGKPAPDPQYPAHRQYRRPLTTSHHAEHPPEPASGPAFPGRTESNSD